MSADDLPSAGHADGPDRSTPPTAPRLSPPTASAAGGGDTPSSPPPAPVWAPAGGWSEPPRMPDAGAPAPTPVSGAPTTAPAPPVRVGSPFGPPAGPPSGGVPGGGVPGGGVPGGGVPGGGVRRTTEPRRGGGLKSALIGGLVGAIVAGGVTAAAMTVRDDNSSPPVAATASVPSRSSSALAGEDLDIRALLDKVRPSVVSIHTGTRQGDAAGSGIVLSEAGLVLTNAHVVQGAQQIEVDFSDGMTATATLVGAVPEADVALVQADVDTAVTPAELGASADLLVGDDVVAIGNALNLGAEPSVTTGIVSQTGRSIQAPDGTVLDDLIQTDAAINPGNSGGPLLNAQGQVVGVNTAILADAQNIGFALEIDSIRSLIDDLEAGRDAQKERPLLGVSTLDLDRVEADVLDQFSVQTDGGAFVQDVTAGSGADVAGITEGDVIVEVDGRRIRTADDVGQAVRAKDPGDSIDVVVDREGEEQTLTATLGAG